MRFLGRALLFCFGLFLAISAGLITLGIGVAIDPSARELVAAFGIASIETFLSDLSGKTESRRSRRASCS